MSGETVALGGHAPEPVAAGGVAVMRRTSAGRNRWLLLVPPDAPVRVNGVPVRTGIRMLHDRDSIRLGASPNIFFSTERLAIQSPRTSNSSVAWPGRLCWCPQTSKTGVGRSRIFSLENSSSPSAAPLKRSGRCCIGVEQFHCSCSVTAWHKRDEVPFFYASGLVMEDQLASISPSRS